MANRKGKPLESFNRLTPKQWVRLSRNVWRGLSPPREDFRREHGATFPTELAIRAIRMYTKEGDLVFDPFLGVGSTLIAAKREGRNGIGIELNRRFCEIARDQFKQSTLHFKNQVRVIEDDCRNMKKHLEDSSVQLVFTSPPYANFIHRSVEDRKKTHKNSLIVKNNLSSTKPYSDDPRDFGNLDYDNFLKEIKSIMKDLFDIVKPGGYNIWVVKDYRDPQNGKPYIDFHSDFARIGESVGFKYHDLIIWDQNEDRSLVLLGYPSVFYTNQNCSFLVVLCKSKR